MDVDALTEGVAINMTRQAEQIDINIKELSISSKPVATAADALINCQDEIKEAAADAVNYYRSRLKTNTSTQQNSDDACGRCGFEVHTKGRCPALDATCKKCNKPGHYARCCQIKSVHNTVAEVPPDDQLFLGTVETCQNSKSWTKTVNVREVKISVKFKLDSGGRCVNLA